MLRRISKHGEVILLLVLILAAVYLISVGLEIPTGRSRSPITPATWPVSSLAIVVVCSVILLIFRFVYRNKPTAEEKAEAAISAEDGLPLDEEVIHPQRALYTLIFMAVYLAALPLLGFIPITLGAMAVFMLSIGASRRYAVIIPLGLTALVTVIFGIALKVPLPRGISVFRELSQIFY